MHTIALDAATGKELWVAKLGDINKGETMTMAPLVVKGKVLVGNSGGEMGVHGWVTALDENTGAIVWRAYGTGSDKEVLIGPEFKPFYPQYKGKDLGITSWPSDAWKIGGGTMWGWISYDPTSTRSSMGPAIPARGTRRSGPATIYGRPPCSPAIPIRARRYGPIRKPRTTCGTTTTSTRASCSTCRSRAGRERSRCTPAATASCT